MKIQVASFPWEQVSCFGRSFFGSFQAGAGLNGAAKSSDRFWKSLREGREFSEDCCWFQCPPAGTLAIEGSGFYTSFISLI